MAQKTANWTASEAYKIIRAGINKAAMQEIAEQAPVFAMYAAKGADEIISALPDFITVQKIERAIKGENVPDVKPEPEKTEESIPSVEATAAEKNEPEKSVPVEEKPKGKHGRPAKVKDEKPEPTETGDEQPKKKRGRPAKVKAPEPVEEAEEEEETEENDEEEQEEETELEEPETEEPAEDDDDDWEI